MRCRILICSQLSSFVMLFWCPAFGPLEECWHAAGPCDTGHQKTVTKKAQPEQIITPYFSPFNCCLSVTL